MEFLTDGILALTWQQIVMFAVGITLWLAGSRQTESLNGCSMWELKPQKSCRFYFSSELAL